jgi:glycosyltransferase involved in cell wall biosynthesis
MPYQVDTEFWQPVPGVRQTNMICSAGLECRDYATLAGAVAPLNLQVQIGAASSWSRKDGNLNGASLPANVDVRSYSYRELRDLYTEARFVVCPLLDVDFQAGITLLLEAMAMSRAVIATRTEGQAGAIKGPIWRDGIEAWPADGPPIEAASGIYVLPGDAAGLRAAIVYLLANPAIAGQLGGNGRAAAERDYTVEAFGRRFAEAILGSPAAIAV